MDWRYAYQEHIRMVTRQLIDARRAGASDLKIATATVRPRAMTDHDIAICAMIDAEKVINMAIIQHNEETERKARQ